MHDAARTVIQTAEEATEVRILHPEQPIVVIGHDYTAIVVGTQLLRVRRSDWRYGDKCRSPMLSVAITERALPGDAAPGIAKLQETMTLHLLHLHFNAAACSYAHHAVAMS